MNAQLVQCIELITSSAAAGPDLCAAARTICPLCLIWQKHADADAVIARGTDCFVELTSVQGGIEGSWYYCNGCTILVTTKAYSHLPFAFQTTFLAWVGELAARLL